MAEILVHNLILPHKPLSDRELDRAVSDLGIPHFRGVFMGFPTYFTSLGRMRHFKP